MRQHRTDSRSIIIPTTSSTAAAGNRRKCFTDWAVMAKLIPRNYYVYLRPITTVKYPTTEVLNGSDQVQIRTARQDRAFFGDL